MPRTLQRLSRSELSGALGAVFALVALCLAISAAALWNRHVYERALDHVILAVDAKEVAKAARDQSLSLTESLQKLRSAGVTAVAVHEYTLQDAVEDGRAFLLTPSGLAALFPMSRAGPSPATDFSSLGEDDVGTDVSEPSPFLFGFSPGAADPWFARALEANLPGDFRLVYLDERVTIWQLPRTRSLAGVSLGFDPNHLAAVREAGLDIIPRLRPSEGRSLDQIRSAIEQIDGEPVAAVVFWGAAATGHPDALGEVAEWLARYDAPVGLVEFAVQLGVNALARALDYRAVRVHSITAEEMQAGIPEDVAVRRWERAVRERGVRLAYVRLYPEASLQESASYLAAVASRLEDAGFRLGRAKVQGGPPGRSPLWTLLLAAAVTGAAGVWLLGRVVARRFDARLYGAGAILICALVLLLWTKGYTVLARQLLAGAAAAIYPALAALAGLTCARSAAWRSEAEGGGPVAAAGIGPALIGFVASVAVTLSGAMVVAVSLDDVRFLLKIEEFRGVKAAYLAPIAVVAVALALESARRLGQGSGSAGERRLWSWLAVPVKLGHVLLAAVLAGVFAVYLLRSGNQGLPIAGLETALRTFLEDSFTARPRTKEFLIGHPAMIAALALAAVSGARRGVVWTPFASLLLLLGTVGPVSVVNTFAHAHSPLDLSLLRTGYGLLIGMPVGIVLAAALLWIAGARAAKSEHSGERRPPSFPAGVGPGSGP